MTFNDLMNYITLSVVCCILGNRSTRYIPGREV